MTKELPLGVLVMAYGTPHNLDEVLPYYTHIRRGHPPTDEQLQDLISRYQAIGGVSPLTEITEKQAAGLEQVLNADGGRPVKVYLGMKHIHPFIPDAVAQMANDGITEAVGIVLAPHYSTMSIGAYEKSAREAMDENGVTRFSMVHSWHTEPSFVRLLASRVQEALDSFEDKNSVMTVFSAHSLPERIIAMNDPYPEQLHESGTAVAELLGLTNYSFAYQSKGQTGEPWLGPDLLEKLEELKKSGFVNIVSCSQGFVADHLEVLYDIDIEAQTEANELDMKLVRTRQLNDDPEFLKVLATVVRGRDLEGAGGA